VEGLPTDLTEQVETGVEGSPPAWSGHADPLCLKEDAGGLVR